jgi:urease accessory protein
MSFGGPGEKLQRAAGAVHVGTKHTERGTQLETLHQSGCLKARFPKTYSGALEAVLINTSGGVTDGDTLETRLNAGSGSTLTVTTPAAERIYRALPDSQPAKIAIDATIEAGARLDYLPQETILFDRCAVNRSLRVDLHPEGIFLGVEALLFGRALSGESLTTLHLRDTLHIKRAGRLILRDGIRLRGDIRALLAARASANQARAIATIVYAAPDAEARLGAVRAALEGADAGASAWDGMVLARIVAPDGQALRRQMVAVLACLRENPLPRLWAS